MTELVVVNLGDYRERIEAAGSLDVHLADGTSVRIPPPDLWPDGVDELIRSKDVEGAYRAVLGDEPYERFMADPHGSHRILDRLFADRHELTLPES